MQLTYDDLTDTLYVYFSQEPVARTVEASKQVVVDYDPDGNVRGIEIIGASDAAASFNEPMPRRDDVLRLIQRTRDIPVPV